MSNVSALLAQYEAIKADINFYTLEQIKWENLHTSQSEKVTQWGKYEEDYNGASQDYCDKFDENGKFEKKGKRWLWTSTGSQKFGEEYVEVKDEKGNIKKEKQDISSAYYVYQYYDGKNTYGKKDKRINGEFPGWGAFIADRDLIASKYASIACPQFANGGSDKLEQFTDLDLQYETELTTVETMLTALRAQEESLKAAVDEAAKDTGMGSGG